MAKEAYYFSHDSNARTDPKILQMRSVYGSEGYGWYWILIEMMREQEGYELSMQGKYVFNAFASQMDTTAERVQCYIEDCVNEFKLFASDGNTFWSYSLKERMKLREEKSEKARKSAEARWKKTKKTEENEQLMQPHSEEDANASKSDAIKEKKVKEIKEKKDIDIDTIDKSIKKIHYADNVTMTEEEYLKLISEYGESVIKEKIIDLDLWKGSKGKKTKSDYLTLLAWIRKDKKEFQNNIDKGGYKNEPGNYNKPNTGASENKWAGFKIKPIEVNENYDFNDPDIM